MRFAIVTPTLNAGGLLRETVDSVLACLGSDDRYTIVDGGSTDGSVEELRRTLPPQVGITQDRGGGMYDAIACGFACTEGEVMGWINASDLLLGGALEVVRSAFASTGADLVHFDDLVVDEEGMIQGRSRGAMRDPAQAMRTVGWTPLQDGCFWTRALYDRVGGVDAQWRVAGDFDFFLRAFHGGRAAFVPGVVSAFRLHAGQLSLGRRSDYRRESAEARRRFIAAHPELRDSMVTRLRRRAALSWRARSGGASESTPWEGRHWSSVPAALG